MIIQNSFVDLYGNKKHTLILNKQNIIIMINNTGFYAIACWRNGELQKGVARYFEDDEDFDNQTASAYSGCDWFFGDTKEEAELLADAYIN